MVKKSKTPFIRDVNLAYLTKKARKTKPDGFPIIEKWMVSTEIPKNVYQWDRRQDVVEESKDIAMSFYCNDPGFTPILGNPKGYLEKLKKYGMVVGMDASPYDNMPLVVQKSQIFLNLAITFYYGLNGIKIIPNVRLGNDDTLSSLDAYPSGTLISIGTNGFTWKLKNRDIFKKQVDFIVAKLRPSGIIVYGPASDYIFSRAIELEIPIYQYDSYTMIENKKDKVKKNER